MTLYLEVGMETKKQFVSLGMLLLCFLIVSCQAEVSQPSVPTRVSSHQKANSSSPRQVLESDQIEFLHASENKLFVHLSENLDNSHVDTDTFLSQVLLVTDQDTKEISAQSSSIRLWNIPLWTNGTKTFWKTVDPLQNEKETLWIDEAGSRQDLYSVLPDTFVADIQNQCMLFQEKEGVFSIVDAQESAQPSLYKIQNPFPTISTHVDNPNNYRPTKLHKFQSGYLLVASNYSKVPYRYIFFPLSNGSVSKPIEIQIPVPSGEEWFLADTNPQANVFALLDYRHIIAHDNALQFPDAPPVDEESSKVARVLLVDLLNPESPLCIESNVYLASAVRILSHPNGAQICIIPKYLDVHPMQTPIWHRNTNSVQIQNPVYIPLDGSVFSDTSLHFLRTDPASWLLFVSGKDSTKTGWILSCKATSEKLLFIEHQLTYDEDFLITKMVSLGNYIYYSVVNKHSFFSAVSNEDSTIRLERIPNQS
jgi:hypothetical protein